MTDNHIPNTRRRSSLLSNLVINAFHLPAPNSPLRRQIAVSSDGIPLSPISLARSVSNQSDEESIELLLRRTLMRYKNRLEENLEKYLIEKITTEAKLENPYDEHERMLLKALLEELSRLLDSTHDKLAAVDNLLAHL